MAEAEHRAIARLKSLDGGKSTLPRACEIERSSGGRTSGAATRAVKSSATAPTPLSAHLSKPKDLRISHFDMIFSIDYPKSRVLYTTEYWSLQCVIGGCG
jgi:hypothetical protein